MCAFALPCMQYAVNERDMDRRNDDGCLCCLAYCCCPFSCLLFGWSRGKVREIVGLPRGSILKRTCIHCFCHPCALAQEARALQEIGVSEDTQYLTKAPDPADMHR